MIRNTRIAWLVLAAAGCSDPSAPLDRGDAGASSPDAAAPRPDASVAPDAQVAAAPELFRLRPGEGSVEGGTFVTLRGEGFTESAQVRFGELTLSEYDVTFLDETSLEVLSPPGEVGFIDVTVVTAGGESTLEDAFRYVPVLEITSVEPDRIPEEGGVELVLRGRGFTEDTLALIDRTPLGGWVLVSDIEMRGLAPSLPPGRPEIRVLSPLADDRSSDLLVVFATPEVDALEPPVVGARGGDLVTLVGTGLEEIDQASIGGEPAALVDVSRERLVLETPALSEGPAVIELRSPDVVYEVPEPLYVVDDIPGLAVAGLAPSTVVQGRATRVDIVGRGFGASLDVEVAGQPVAILAADTSGSADRVAFETPVNLAVGDVSVRLVSDGVAVDVPGGLDVRPELLVTAVSPESAAADASTLLTVTGGGFLEGVEVRIGGVLLQEVEVLADDVLVGTLPGGPGGVADVVVRAPDGQRDILPAAFRFEEAFAFIRVEPEDGSIAGNTYVTVFGRGLQGPATVQFGSEPGTDVRLENGSVLAVRAPPGDIGIVNLEVDVSGESFSLPEGYAYFDPRLIVGGGFGGPIRGDVNVAVLDSQGNAVPGAAVQLGYDADPRLRRTTDADGLATISSPDVVGPLTVTAGANGTQFTTFYDINTRNLTAISAPFPRPREEDAPVFPCPSGEPPRIRGRVFGLKSEIDPDQDPNIVPLVTITYSQPNVFQTNPPLPEGQIVTVDREGAIFEIVTARQGTVAVYAVLEEVDTTNPAIRTRRRMGIVRGVPAVADQVTEGVDIELSIELDQTVDIRLDEPPTQSPGPSLNAVFPYLNVGSDGVIPFPPQGASSDLVTLQNMPRLASSDFIYLAGSLTQAGAGLGAPFSLAIQPAVQDPDEGTDLGPFLQPPQNLTPKFGEVLDDGVIRFEREGLVPDLSITDFTDSLFVASVCCFDGALDGNPDGDCDDDSDVENPGGGPVPFTRWSLYGPGEGLSIELPRLPPGVDAFDRPQFIGYGIQQARAPRFTFAEFNYTQFSALFWESWTSVSGAVVIKEVTD